MLLSVRDLTVGFAREGAVVPVVEDVSFDVRPGEAVGIVGESGSGKTVTAMAITGLTRSKGGHVLRGSVVFEGRQLLRLSDREIRRVRGDRIGMIFQEPVRSLNPAFTVGEQIAETLRCNRGLSRRDAWRRAVQLLDRVEIANAERRAHDYPHTFSGGMCQRVMIAIALACDPALIIADEPTTAIDVTVQSKILDLLRSIQEERGMAILFISHDLSVIAEMCHQVIVMYAGEVVESADVHRLFDRPRHPYTAGLLASIAGPGSSKRLTAIDGYVPPPGSLVDVCRFHPRCAYAVDACRSATPPLVPVGHDARARCIRVDELELQGASSS